MTRYCIRCGEPHCDDSSVCAPCSYAECPGDHPEEHTVPAKPTAREMEAYRKWCAEADARRERQVTERDLRFTMELQKKHRRVA